MLTVGFYLRHMAKGNLVTAEGYYWATHPGKAILDELDTLLIVCPGMSFRIRLALFLAS